MSKFYIHRKLYHGEQLTQDHELRGQSGVLVVLAEPGAGKTDLLDYFGRSYGVSRESASLFVHQPPSNHSVLIVDALDEVARIDENKINEIIVKARASGANTIIFASRSYVWDEARTRVARDCFGIEPKILRLEPFDEDEQRQLFEHYLPTEDFVTFRAEANRLDLTPILGNPQFLQLFADGYVEGGRRFLSKRQIYADALRRLASESQNTAGLTDRPPTNTILVAAGEIFAKLLLSGAAGVSAREDIGDDTYPYIRRVGPDDGAVTFTLNTRLFKPTTSVNRHEPVHRIVAEYCAADYLVKRIEDPTNTLSMRRCLAIVAPNGTVRNELRGMLGWMASLGGQAIQENIVDLDPYAVFANGDASQLLPTSKQRLLKGLESLAKIDPFFRRMDSWRRFNVAGFFSNDMVDYVRPLLSPAGAKSHLRGLLLELLHGADAATGLQQEFRAILHDPQAETIEREQAYRNLDAISEVDFDDLVGQASREALEIASDMVSKRGVDHFGMTRALRLVKALAPLYPSNAARERTIGSRYFIRELVASFRFSDTRHLLNEVTADLDCICGNEKPHRCTCRRGRSKIGGHLLDHYFETMIGPHNPQEIARWTRPLVFRGPIRAERSASVQALSSNHGLRRAIQIAAFNGVSSQEDISEALGQFYGNSSHSGLAMRGGDYQTIVDHAIATGNHALWEHCIVRHSPYTERKGPDELRAHMRAQARQSADLLRRWGRVERRNREQVRRDFMHFGRSNKSYRRRAAKRKEDHFADLQKNRALIEAGQHWGWLRFFAEHYLYGSDEIEAIVGNPQIVERALLNCFDFLAPHVPSLAMLAEPHGTAIAMVLHAACLARFRQTGSLEGIALEVLQAVKTDGISGKGYKEGEAVRLETELDRLAFPSDSDAVAFLRRFIEPQLARSEESATKVYILDHCSVFRRVKGATALDWLIRFPKMPSSAQQTLFGTAAVHADRAQLNALIATRCNDPVDTSKKGQERRQFWLLRHFFFIVPTSDALWAEFSKDPKAIFQIEQYAGRMSRHDAEGWPQLNAEQIYRVLDSFVPLWPKVHLPNTWGSGDPEDETAYRFLSEAIFPIGQDDPSKSIPVFDRILSDARFSDFHTGIRSLKATAIRQLALSGFQAPRPEVISRLLEESKIASVEDMRAVLIELLDEIQGRLKGAATNPAEVFYSGGKRVDENTARNRIVEMLEARLNAMHLGVVIEHQMSDATRCDFTASTSISGSPAVLVIEVKGQWNKELYTAAAAQLAEHYTIYPGAADQGVYLVLWFGGSEVVAAKKAPSITSAVELRQEIIARMPKSLLGRIDVYVLDVSKMNKSSR